MTPTPSGVFHDATVVPGGAVTSFRTHAFASVDQSAVAALRPLLRKPTYVGPLEFELDLSAPGLDGREVPWLDWRRDGPDASATLKSSAGLPLTNSMLVSGRGGHDQEYLQALADLAPSGDPAPGDTPLVAVPRRPLIATRVHPAAVAVPEELLHMCARLEVLLAATFFAILDVHDADDSLH